MNRHPPLAGRDDEFALLASGLERAGNGLAPVILIEGDPGIGKSTLLSTFSWAEGERSRRLRIFAIRAPGGEVYDPVEEAALAATHKRVYQRLGGRRRTLQLVRELAPDWLSVLPGIGGLASALTATAGALRRRKQGSAQEETPDEDVEALVRIARRRPLALFFDDLERAGGDALARVEALVRAAEGTRLLVVGAYRPTAPGVADPPVHSLRSRLPSDRCTPVKLKPLAPASVESWLRERFPGTLIPSSFREWFIGATGGHPGTMHATVAHLLGTSAIRQAGDGWEFDTDPEQLDLPVITESFADLTAINPYIAEVVQAASVLGDEFDALTLSRLLERDELAVEDQLALGIHYGLLESLGEAQLADGEWSTAYRFSAMHLRSALHRALPAEQRIRLEGRLAADAARP